MSLGRHVFQRLIQKRGGSEKITILDDWMQVLSGFDNGMYSVSKGLQKESRVVDSIFIESLNPKGRLHNIGIAIYRVCGVEEETPRHLLMICDAVPVKRARSFGLHQII